MPIFSQSRFAWHTYCSTVATFFCFCFFIHWKRHQTHLHCCRMTDGICLEVKQFMTRCVSCTTCLRYVMTSLSSKASCTVTTSGWGSSITSMTRINISTRKLTAITSRVCGRGNVFAMSVCVCSGYNFLTGWHRNFIFGMVLHLDHI